MNYKLCLPFILFFIYPVSVHSAPIIENAQDNKTEIHYFQTDERYEYRIKLLELALSNTEGEWGPYKLIADTRNITQGRGSLLLEQNKGIDIASFPTSYEREKRFTPIRIPILQGILGYRVLLIHKDNQKKFSNINSLEQLKTNHTAGFGEQWADLKILKSNQLPVSGIPQYELLFAMLNKKRFDYFPRGINEAWIEIEKYQYQYIGLMVEPSIALYYPFYVYFFVSKNNPALAERIKMGLESALKNGSFKMLYKKYHQPIITKANLNNRKIFFLDNPYIPPIEKMPEVSWWLHSLKPTLPSVTTTY